MSILTKIKSWFFGGTTKEADDADLAPYKMEPPTLEEAVLSNTPTFPFLTRVGSVPTQGAIEVAEAKPARKPRAPAKPKAVKAKPAAAPKVKAPAKPKAEAKPKAAPKTKAKKS